MFEKPQKPSILPLRWQLSDEFLSKSLSYQGGQADTSAMFKHPLKRHSIGAAMEKCDREPGSFP